MAVSPEALPVNNPAHWVAACFLLFASVSVSAAPDRLLVTGTASSLETGNIVYREYHDITEQQHTVRYVDPDEKLIASKDIFTLTVSIRRNTNYTTSALNGAQAANGATGTSSFSGQKNQKNRIRKKSHLRRTQLLMQALITSYGKTGMRS
ncbi:MAG: hypothetical protein IPK95_13090 [Cellvibrionales bacterium]|nr:hypothetical protein [Cellvibrionales bacterium]